MLITIKTSDQVWTSPDGQRKVWDLTDENGNKWQTMSQQIANSVGQTMELTTRVSNAGKTYLVKPSMDGVGVSQPTLGGVADARVVETLQSILEALKQLTDVVRGKGGITSDLPPVENYDDIGEVVDDL